jgi:hypothetical protein
MVARFGTPLRQPSRSADCCLANGANRQSAKLMLALSRGTAVKRGWVQIASPAVQGWPCPWCRASILPPPPQASPQDVRRSGGAGRCSVLGREGRGYHLALAATHGGRT